ncbi:MAG: hypothetical protein ABIB43_05560 [archaeon]
MQKEPSKQFFKLFTILFILNIIFSIFVYLVVPEQIPSRLTQQGFEGYQSKIYVLIPIVFQIMLLGMASLFYKAIPMFFKTYPKVFQKVFIKYSQFLLGKNSDDVETDVLISKYISVLVLAISAFLIPYNLINLGFAFELSNLNNYFIGFIVLIIIGIIPLFRILSKQLR